MPTDPEPQPELSLTMPRFTPADIERVHTTLANLERKRLERIARER